MDTRKLIASGNAEEIRTDDGNMVATTDNRLVERTTSEKQELVRELVRRWNAYPELVEALKGLVQTIEFQAEGNFLNEDADEGEENDLTRARHILNTLKTN